jgi:NADPH:quinone reductase-like Zn-dependent oxidoreductase
MRGAGITHIGGQVQVLELPAPRRLASDEILVAVKAAGVGNWDEFVRTGGWDVGRRPPMALGVEAAGVIEAVGDRVRGLALGDEVMTHPLPLRQEGTWTEKLIAPAALVARKPPNVSWHSAGAFPVPALTAEQVFEEAVHIREGEWILVHGAGGVTGGMLVQLAVAKGAAVVTTASPARAPLLRENGAVAVLDYHEAEWPVRVRELTGGSGVPAAVNAAPGQAEIALQAVMSDGRLATITGDPPQPERGITVANVYVRPDGRQLTGLAALLAAGKLAVPIGAAYPIEEAATALAAAGTGHADGAIVLSAEEA